MKLGEDTGVGKGGANCVKHCNGKISCNVSRIINKFALSRKADNGRFS